MKLIICFIAFSLLIITNHCTAQKMAQLDSARSSDEPIPRRYRNLSPRDPGIALLLSYVLPGGGQFYNRQYGKAIVVGSAQTASLVGLYVVLYNNLNFSGDNGNDHKAIVEIIGVGAALIGSTVYSYIDAPRSANKLNRLYHLKDNTSKSSFTSVNLYPSYIVTNNTAFNSGSFGLKLTLR